MPLVFLPLWSSDGRAFLPSHCLTSNAPPFPPKESPSPLSLISPPAVHWLKEHFQTALSLAWFHQPPQPPYPLNKATALSHKASSQCCAGVFAAHVQPCLQDFLLSCRQLSSQHLKVVSQMKNLTSLSLIESIKVGRAFPLRHLRAQPCLPGGGTACTFLEKRVGSCA